MSGAKYPCNFLILTSFLSYYKYATGRDIKMNLSVPAMSKYKFASKNFKKRKQVEKMYTGLRKLMGTMLRAFALLLVLACNPAFIEEVAKMSIFTICWQI